MRKYYFVSESTPKGKPVKRINIIKSYTDVDNPQGYFEKDEDSPIFVNMSFLTEDGKRIFCEHTLIGQALGMIADFFTKEDLVSLCEVMYIWG